MQFREEYYLIGKEELMLETVLFSFGGVPVVQYQMKAHWVDITSGPISEETNH